MAEKFEFSSSGMLKLTDIYNLTLEDLEAFCAEARKLGLPDKTRLNTSRQGLLGPVACWYFSVPVVPKKEE